MKLKFPAENLFLVEGLVNRIWYTKLKIRSRFSRKIRVGFGPIATGEDNLAERKWRIDPIIDEMNRQSAKYTADCFIHPHEMENFDINVIVKRFHSDSIPMIEKLKKMGKKFIYDIVDNPNAGRRHRVYFGDCPEFSSQMDAFILSSPLHESDAKKFTDRYSLIEHPIINHFYKNDYEFGERIKILAHGYFENLKVFKELEPLIDDVSRKIGRPITLIYHSEKIFENTESVRYVKWTVENSFRALLDADIAITAKDLLQRFQKAKPSTKVITFLAAGLPVVCTPSPADELILQNGKTALFAYSPDDWKRCLTLLCTDQKLREALGRGGRARVIQDFSVAQITRKYLALLDRLF